MDEKIWLRCPECGEKRRIATLEGGRCRFLQVDTELELVPLTGRSRRISREELSGLRCSVCSWSGTVEDLVTPDYFHTS